MWFITAGLPGALQIVDDNVDTLLASCTEARLARLNADITSRAPQSTALDIANWTDALAAQLLLNCDAKISQIGGEVSGDTYNVQNFNSDGTFTVPIGFKGILFVTLIGGGGGGGSEYTPSPGTQGGGGAGGGAIYYRWPIWIDQAVTPTVAVTVGDGGAIQASGGGGSGGDTIFGSFLTAFGGSGGDGNSSTASGGAPGGTGGQLSSKGSKTVEGDGIDSIPIVDLLFPVYRNMRFGFWCEGGQGGHSVDDGSNGSNGGRGIYDETLHVQYHDMEGSNDLPVSALTATNPSTSEGGGGGNSFGKGGYDSTLPETDSGSGGQGADASGSPAQEDGANGKCIVEYWT